MQGEQLPVTIAQLAHDLLRCLDVAAGTMLPLPLHPAFVTLQRALAAGAVQQHIHSVVNADPAKLFASE